MKWRGGIMSRTTKAKSKALVEEIVRKVEVDPANMGFL